ERILAQYAAFAAVRTGSVNHGNCQRMGHAAILAVLPSIQPFIKAGPGTPGAKLAAAWALRRNNTINEMVTDGGTWRMNNGTIIWIAREQPTVAQVAAFANGQDQDFDQPRAVQQSPRLEIRLIYWMP